MINLHICVNFDRKFAMFPENLFKFFMKCQGHFLKSQKYAFLFDSGARNPPTLANLFKIQSKINGTRPFLKILMEILPLYRNFSRNIGQSYRNICGFRGKGGGSTPLAKPKQLLQKTQFVSTALFLVTNLELLKIKFFYFIFIRKFRNYLRISQHFVICVQTRELHIFLMQIFESFRKFSGAALENDKFFRSFHYKG